MLSFLVTLGTWDWFIAGAVLLVLEILAPGVFMLWLGLAALLVGAISLVVDWPWQAQFVAFAVFAVAAIPIWRRLARRVGAPTDQPFLNRLDDTVWRVTGPDTPAGSRVKVTRVDGVALHVEPA